MFSNELVKLFAGYNLTKNQSLILATLSTKNSYLSVKEISQFSNLARETTYKVLFDLKEKGLVQKAITTPKKYKAIPLKTILQILHHQKTSQIHVLEKLTKQVLTNKNNSENDNLICQCALLIYHFLKCNLFRNLAYNLFRNKHYCLV